MKGLILDTSSQNALLGLIKSGSLESYQKLPGGKNLSGTLFPFLETFCNLQDLSYIAIGVGPGSYMGVRTGATIAKTLAFACDLPLITFNSIVAFLPKEIRGTFAFVGDAKMGQNFIITGKANEHSIEDLSSPLLIDPSETEKYTENKDWVINDYECPNFIWATKQAHHSFIQGNTLGSKSLSLSYLR